MENARKREDDEAENTRFKLCSGLPEKLTEMHKARRWKLDNRGTDSEALKEFVPVAKDIYVLPNESALEFYLCNRMPEKYKVKQAALPAGKEDHDSRGMGLSDETEKHEEHVEEAEIVET